MLIKFFTSFEFQTLAQLVICVLLFKIGIIFIKKFQFGQVVRDDGPSTHLKKSGTPTMGGIVFIFIFILITIINYLLKRYYFQDYEMIFLMIAFGLIGFIDDYLKVSKKNTKGLKSIYKLILQVILSVISIKIIVGHIPNDILLFLLLVFVIVGTNNGVNFTDGLDGLCACVTILISIFYIIVSIIENEYGLVYINFSILLMLIAFLVYNHYPAKLFMGDTGSLFLGGYVALMAISLNIELCLPIFGFVYMMEVLSVILQVSYFKMTKGKRIFKMAPIHHHFEKCGMSENKVVFLFSLITLIGIFVSIFILFLI